MDTENRCRLALEAIAGYKQRITKRPIMNVEFKGYALSIARDALGPENDTLPVDYRATLEKESLAK